MECSRPGFRIHWESVGVGGAEPLLLVAGMGEQIGSVEFPDEHCALFANRGFAACGWITATTDYPSRMWPKTPHSHRFSKHRRIPSLTWPTMSRPSSTPSVRRRPM